MQLNEFQNLALRTESQIETVNVNPESLLKLLEMVVDLTEVLDGVKKAVFYNKDAKLGENLVDRLTNIRHNADIMLDSAAFKGPVESIKGFTPQSIPAEILNPRVFHGVLGIITEAGELAEAIAKPLYDNSLRIDPINIQEEMSDIAWYKAILHDELKLDWGQGLTNVINKLRIRYPDKYSDEAADNRDLAAEREALSVGVPDTVRAFDERIPWSPENALSLESLVSPSGEILELANHGGVFGDKPTFFGIETDVHELLVEPSARRVFYVDLPDNASPEEFGAALEAVTKSFRDKEVETQYGVQLSLLPTPDAPEPQA